MWNLLKEAWLMTIEERTSDENVVGETKDAKILRLEEELEVMKKRAWEAESEATQYRIAFQKVVKEITKK